MILKLFASRLACCDRMSRVAQYCLLRLPFCDENALRRDFLTRSEFFVRTDDSKGRACSLCAFYFLSPHFHVKHQSNLVDAARRPLSATNLFHAMSHFFRRTVTWL